jgi:hypothetical protein
MILLQGKGDNTPTRQHRLSNVPSLRGFSSSFVLSTSLADIDGDFCMIKNASFGCVVENCSKRVNT